MLLGLRKAKALPESGTQQQIHAFNSAIGAKRRRKRMEELRKGKALPKFGTLEQIRGTEFVQKVTNAGEGVWVVCLLYKDRCAARLGRARQEASYCTRSPTWMRVSGWSACYRRTGEKVTIVGEGVSRACLLYKDRCAAACIEQHRTK